MKRFWTDSEVETLRKIYPDTPTPEVAKHFNRPVGQVYNKAHALGLRKSAEYLAGPHASRLRRGDNVGKDYRFKPGFTPWNKGKPFKAGGRSHETQFKKGVLQGRAAEIAQPIGAERVTKDGYLQRKINNDLPMQSRWRAIHVIEWEAVNGPLPDGHLIIFKDGNKRNIALENLELITRAENMRRNTMHRYPKEITDAIRSRAVLNRRINHVEKQQHR